MSVFEVNEGWPSMRSLGRIGNDHSLLLDQCSGSVNLTKFGTPLSATLGFSSRDKKDGQSLAKGARNP